MNAIQLLRGVLAAAEPQPAPDGSIAGVLKLLQRRLHGRIQDSRLTLTPYLVVDVYSGDTSYTAGYAEVQVRFAGYVCYVTAVEMADPDLEGVVAAVKSVIKHARGAARTQPDVDRFSVALGMEMQKLQHKSIADAYEDGRPVSVLPTKYTMVWYPASKQYNIPTWRALGIAYTTLRSHA